MAVPKLARTARNTDSSDAMLIVFLGGQHVGRSSTCNGPSRTAKAAHAKVRPDVNQGIDATSLPMTTMSHAGTADKPSKPGGLKVLGQARAGHN